MLLTKLTQERHRSLSIHSEFIGALYRIPLGRDFDTQEILNQLLDYSTT